MSSGTNQEKFGDFITCLPTFGSFGVSAIDWKCNPYFMNSIVLFIIIL